MFAIKPTIRLVLPTLYDSPKLFIIAIRVIPPVIKPDKVIPTAILLKALLLVRNRLKKMIKEIRKQKFFKKSKTASETFIALKMDNREMMTNPTSSK